MSGADMASLEKALSMIFTRRLRKSEAHGIHGTLFYGHERKKIYYPTRRDEEAANPYPTRLLNNSPESFRSKTEAVFRELVGTERSGCLADDVPSSIVEQVALALSSDYEPKVARNIAFHVSDWQADAAFLVALHLFPERFTAEEIEDGVHSLLLHVPAHVVAVAEIKESSNPFLQSPVGRL